MLSTTTDIIAKIQKNKDELGITLYDGASDSEIETFETAKKLKLPDDFKKFHRFCDGFESQKDMFRIIPLGEIIENGHDNHTVEEKDFHFGEYMIYCDMWTININPQDNNNYKIYNKAGDMVILTNSFAYFLIRFLEGGVFEGLYSWREGRR